MQAIGLNSWSTGFVATRLSHLLREYHFGLTDAHRFASDFVDGQKLSIVFDRAENAQRLAEAVRALKVDAFVSQAMTAKAG